MTGWSSNFLINACLSLVVVIAMLWGVGMMVGGADMLLNGYSGSGYEVVVERDVAPDDEPAGLNPRILGAAGVLVGALLTFALPVLFIRELASRAKNGED